MCKPNGAGLLWNGYVNMAKPSVLIGGAMGGVVANAASTARKRWIEEEGDDPFDPFAPSSGTHTPTSAPEQTKHKKGKKGGD